MITKVVVFCLFICTTMGQEVLVMKTMSEGIGSIVLQCQKEMQFKNDVINDFMDFWNEKNDLKSKEFGCTLVCVFKKLEILSDDGKAVMRSNADTFSRAIGADEKMTVKMIELFQLCKEATEKDLNQCEAALQTTKCFRYGIFQLHWAPENQQKVVVKEGESETEVAMAARRDTDDEQVEAPSQADVTEPPKSEGLPSLRQLVELLVRRRFRKNSV